MICFENVLFTTCLCIFGNFSEFLIIFWISDFVCDFLRFVFCNVLQFPASSRPLNYPIQDLLPHVQAGASILRHGEEAGHDIHDVRFPPERSHRPSLHRCSPQDSRQLHDGCLEFRSESGRPCASKSTAGQQPRLCADRRCSREMPSDSPGFRSKGQESGQDGQDLIYWRDNLKS